MTAYTGPIRLGKKVESRISDLGLEYTEVAQRAGFSVETLSKIRKGVTVKPLTYRRLERALQWQQGSADDVLSGDEPRSLEDLPAEGEPEAPAPLEEIDPRAEAILTILADLPPRVQVDVMRRLGDRIPTALRSELEAKWRAQRAG
jgi:transcriptional regulator with XRE-family HTH domain